MANTEMWGTFNGTVGVKLDIDEAVEILPIDDVPLQRRIASESTNSIKVEWLEEDLTPQEAEVVSTVDTASPWDVVLTDASAVRVGDVYQLRGAATGVQYLVTAVDYGTDTATVSSFGTADDTNDPVAADEWELVGQYRNEGSDPEDPRSVDRTMPFNYTQFGQEAVQVTRTRQKQALYGLSDPFGHEVMKKFKELGIRFERSMVHGQRVQSGDTKKRFMGGLLYFLTTQSASNTKANIKTAINALVQDIYAVGGFPRLWMVSPAIKVAISQNFDASTRRSERSDRLGGYIVERVLTDFGELEVAVNRHFPTTKSVVLQTEYIRRRPFDPYFYETLAKTGDAENGHIVGEQSLEVKNERAHGVLTVTDA